MTPLTVDVLATLNPNESAITEWLRMFVLPGSITELRALNVKRRYGKPVTISGFYDHDHLDVMVRDAMTLTNRGMDSKPAPGVYFVINPVRPEIFARRANRCDVAESGSLTNDQDIISRRWLLIDVDPVRPASISANDAEKTHAEDVALAVYQWLKDQGWPRPLVVDSGNGWHLYYRIDLPVDDGGMIKSVLHALAARFDTLQAKIDTTVFNPSRISKLPGTKSRKGDDIAGRPHRWSKIFDTPPDLIPVTQSQLTAIAAESQPQTQPPTIPGTKSADGIRLNARTAATPNRPGRDVIDRARKYLASMPPAIAGQNGHGAAYNAACRLVKGFALSAAEAMPLLAEWNQRCIPPWTDAELRHKLASAESSSEEMGSLLVDSRSSRPITSSAADEVYEIDDPRRLATLFLDRHCTAAGERRLIRWNSEWFLWDFRSYVKLQEDEARSRILNLIQQEFEADAIDRLAAYEKIPDDKKDKGSKPPMARKVTTTLLKDVLAHLSAMTVQPPTAKLPSWIRNQPTGFDSRETIVTQNGLVNLRKLTSGDPDYLTPATPDYFCTNCMPFRFDEQAPEPVEWLRFLNDLWPNDHESIQCLQEWMGLLLVPDNRLQKILLIIGPPRSGKGTIGKVIHSLIGEANVAGPTLAGLATNFGLSSLIGKQAAIIGDARLSAKTDSAIITERLLSISGDDPITIDRKYIPAITTTLPTRLVVLTNEIPRLTDSSSALARRFVVLRMTNSFYGQEDDSLAERLLTELPSILIWAIMGWQRLRENGRFTIPQSSHELATQLADIASPVSAFIREKCDVRSEFAVDRKLLYDEWAAWCEAEHRQPGTSASLGIALRSVVPDLQDIQRRSLGVRIREYGGIRLKSFETDPSELQ